MLVSVQPRTFETSPKKLGTTSDPLVFSLRTSYKLRMLKNEHTSSLSNYTCFLTFQDKN